MSGVGDFGRLESSRRSASHQCVRTHGSVCFASSLPCSSVRLFGSFLTDNVSVMTFIDRQGGTHSIVLNDLASRLWAWCRAARIFPIASHIPGEENLIADFLSRGKCLPSEWMLSPIVFRQIMSVFGVLDIDLFATSLNHRLPRFYSSVRDPGAFARDAFAFPWGGEGLMPFPRSR